VVSTFPVSPAGSRSTYGINNIRTNTYSKIQAPSNSLFSRHLHVSPADVSSSSSNEDSDILKTGYPGLKVPIISDTSLRIVLVANGRTVLTSTKGAEVDQHDIVGRFNFFKTDGFEKNVGSKVDLWFIGELKEPGPRGSRGSLGPRGGTMNLKIRPKKFVIPIVYPTPHSCFKKSSVQRCVPSKVEMKYRKSTQNLLRNIYGKYKLDDLVEFMPLAIEQLLQVKYKYLEKWPSSGILALIYCLESYPNAKISLLGYDFGGPGLGHYWEKILKTTTVHSMRNEGRFLNKLIDTGRVQRL